MCALAVRGKMDRTRHGVVLKVQLYSNAVARRTQAAAPPSSTGHGRTPAGGVIVRGFFKQKTAYEMESRDWSSDVCSSD
eukprot:COSAG05_NODE_15591_length_366_cov_0.513109_1_plen_78_part_01